MIRQVLEERPGHQLYRHSLAKTLMEAGKLEDALAEYETLARYQPGWAIGHSEAAAVLLELGRYEEAIDSARRAIELPPRNTSAHGTLANALWKLGRFRAALEAAESGIEAVPGRVRPVLVRGLACEALGDVPEAARSYCEILELRPDLDEARKALIRLMERYPAVRSLPEVAATRGALRRGIAGKQEG